MPIIKTGWLNDANGERFAPKTLTSQVQTGNGILLEDVLNKKADSTKAVTYENEQVILPAKDLTNNSRTLSVKLDTTGVHFVKINETLEADELIGRWIEINGEKAYVGDNTIDTLVLYIDEIMSQPKAFTVTAGDIIYPADATDIGSIIKKDTLEDTVSWDYTENKLVKHITHLGKYPNLTVGLDTTGVHYVKVDTTNGELFNNELAGCWVEINGEKAYIGSNTKDYLVLYTDSTMLQPKAFTVAVGDIVYPIDIDISKEIVQDIILPDVTNMTTWEEVEKTITVPGKDLHSTSRNLTVKANTNGVHFVKIDITNGELKMNELQGRWIELNGEKAYVGSNTVDTLVLYTDKTLSQPKATFANIGDIIYPANIDVIEEADLATKTYVTTSVGAIEAQLNNVNDTVSQKSQVQIITWEGDD